MAGRHTWIGGALGWVLLLELACTTEVPRQVPGTVAAEPQLSEVEHPEQDVPEQAAPLPPPPRHAILTDEIRAAREIAQRTLLRPRDSLQPDPPPLPEGPLPGPNQAGLPDGLVEGELPGFFAPLHQPEGSNALQNFETALSQLEAGEAQKPVRLAFYGASGVAADLWTGYVRAYLRERFGDGGPGLVAAARPSKWFRHHDFEVRSSKHWVKQNGYRHGETPGPGYFGAMGQAMTCDSSRCWTEIVPRDDSPSAQHLSRYEVHYLQQVGGGRFSISVDGEPVAEGSTAGTGGTLGLREIHVDPGASHSLRIELVDDDAPVTLLGISAETGSPGVVLDTLGVNGAEPKHQLVWDEDIWAEHLRLREPVLYVLAYGHNEAVHDDTPITEYVSEYRTMLERFAAAAPQASCVMIGPADFPILAEDGSPQPRPRVAEIREVQRELAAHYGCAFLDLLELYGGPGASSAWVQAGLGKQDYLHLTRPGYLRAGIAIGDALVQGYDWRLLVQDNTTTG